MHRIAIAFALCLTACTPANRADVTKASPMELTVVSPTQHIRPFPPFAGAAPSRSNREIAADFIDLEFSLENGRALPILTRFDGPVTVGMRGDVPDLAAADLEDLLARLRVEAGINIATTSAANPSIVIEFLPRNKLQAAVPTAACFVAPRVSSWADYKRNRRTDVLDWTTLTRRDQLAVFIPSDTSPQDVRDCLHEELAQAIGPLNDLYRLPDSVFNDDNFQAVLTRFDMLILRMHNSPDLQNGMTAAEVAARLPALLTKLNPIGDFSFQPGTATNARPWTDLIETALGPKTPDKARLRAAERALAAARAAGWSDNRLAFSHYVLARLSMGQDVPRAIAAYAEASRLYLALPDGPLHAAHVDMQMAAFALSSGQPVAVISLANTAIPVAKAAQNAALLATLMLLKAQALDQLGRVEEAQALRLDSLGFARYGFGTNEDVRARMADIDALSPVDTGG